MENNNQLKIFRQKFLRNAKHAISARGSSVDQQNALAPIRRVGSCKEGVCLKMLMYAEHIMHLVPHLCDVPFTSRFFSLLVGN